MKSYYLFFLALIAHGLFADQASIDGAGGEDFSYYSSSYLSLHDVHLLEGDASITKPHYPEQNLHFRLTGSAAKFVYDRMDVEPIETDCVDGHLKQDVFYCRFDDYSDTSECGFRIDMTTMTLAEFQACQVSIDGAVGEAIPSMDGLPYDARPLEGEVSITKQIRGEEPYLGFRLIGSAAKLVYDRMDMEPIGVGCIGDYLKQDVFYCLLTNYSNTYYRCYFLIDMTNKTLAKTEYHC